MKTVCKINQCTGCAACVSKCFKHAIHIADDLKAFNAIIDESLCVNCRQCERVCPTNNPVVHLQPASWQQGWALDKKMRLNASSGGVASAVAIGFIKTGGVVCSCVFESGKFVFDFADNENSVKHFVGSKYVKSNPDGIYEKINGYLAHDRKVLFIGLPCQTAGVRSYVKDHVLLYTIDLICHGTPSQGILQMFLNEKGYSAEQMQSIDFRRKTEFFLSVNQESVEPDSVRDRYTYAFLKALCYTENCYSCSYASVQRVSDLTLGDSWGSMLSVAEQKRGISLVLCQSHKGNELLADAELHLESVNIDNAVKNNRQLNEPSKKPKQYGLFYETLKKKGSFCCAVKKCYPGDCFRQDLKKFLIKSGFWHC